ncbi:unnamed protein product [Tuber aestivum]|uniref:Uncharacterized protein n=1 Tax=Tuber aestivum TaxID=59557 RepID=A0A292PK85_9PEZI|nr:unnamed protein product [Tuber aestivum]
MYVPQLDGRMDNFRRSVREVVYIVKVLWTESVKRRKRVGDVNDDGEVIEDPQDITIVTAPVPLSAPPGTPPSAPPSGPTLLTLLYKPLRLETDGFVIPELPILSPLPISSLPGTPIDITDSLIPQSVEKAKDDQHSAIAEEVTESEIPIY